MDGVQTCEALVLLDVPRMRRHHLGPQPVRTVHLLLAVE